MFALNARRGSALQLPKSARDWLDALPEALPDITLPDIDPGELRRDALRALPGGRRERNRAIWVLPGVLVAIALGVVGARWLLARRWEAQVPAALQPAVQDPLEFDRDAMIRAATEGMEAFDDTMAPVASRDAGAA